MSLADDIWWTRKSRIYTEKRLLANAAHVKAVSLWYAFASVSASIYYLQFDHQAETLWVIYASLILAISAYSSGSNLRERASLIKECYENLKILSREANEAKSDEAVDRVDRKYLEVLALCENHEDIDFKKALMAEHLSNPSKPDPDTNLKKGMTKTPTRVHYVHVTVYTVKRWVTLTFLYALPIVVFYIGESIGE